MLVNFNGPICGFYYREIVDFINNKIVQNGGISYFYIKHTCESWSDTGKKLWDILSTSAISGAKKNAYAWSTLALAVCFTKRQKQMDKIKVNKLQELFEEQKILINILVGMVKTQG